MIGGPTRIKSLGSSSCACKTLLVMLKIQSLQALQTSATLGMSSQFGIWLNMRIHKSAFNSEALMLGTYGVIDSQHCPRWTLR